MLAKAGGDVNHFVKMMYLVKTPQKSELMHDIVTEISSNKIKNNDPNYKLRQIWYLENIEDAQIISFVEIDQSDKYDDQE